MDQSSLYIKTIQSTYPDLSVHSIETNTHGQNNDILVVNEEFIFRFPKYADGIARLETEIAILKGISDAITLPVPRIIFEHIAPPIVGQVFVGYRLLPGEALWRETLRKLDNEQTLERLAQQLAQFLKELHAIQVETANEHQPAVADTYEEWKNIYSRIQAKCFPHMRLDARISVTHHVEAFLADPAHFAYRPVLKHGDFGPSNILIDLDKQVISGIIDFGGAGLGDPAYDFAGILSSYGEAFLRRFASTYPEMEAFWDRITFYQGTFALLEALFGLENQDSSAFKSGIEDYM